MGAQIHGTYVWRLFSLAAHCLQAFCSVAVFDILRRQDSDSAFALLQPRPRLADVLAFHNFASPSSTGGSSHDGLPQALLDALPNLNSAFVGAIRESGSLYAMSPERFPLVAFGASNSAEHGYYLDAPSGSDPPLSAIDDEIPARELRERCWCRSDIVSDLSENISDCETV